MPEVGCAEAWCNFDGFTKFEIFQLYVMVYGPAVLVVLVIISLAYLIWKYM